MSRVSRIESGDRQALFSIGFFHFLGIFSGRCGYRLTHRTKPQRPPRLIGSPIPKPHLASAAMSSIFSRVQGAVLRAAHGSDKAVTKQSFYELADKLIDGTPVSMSAYKGDVLLVVNVASK